MRKTVYCACHRCTAKWFCPAPLVRCPRCGSSGVLAAKGTPPWERAERQVAGCSTETPGNDKGQARQPSAECMLFQGLQGFFDGR